MPAKQLAGQVAMVDDAGHYPHSEFPSQLAGLILPFLKQAFHS